MKRQKINYRRGEKIFTKHVSDKWLVSRLYKELSNLNNKKKSNVKMDKKHEETFHQGGYTDGKQMFNIIRLGIRESKAQ